MSTKCPNCRSTDTVAAVQGQSCLNCGKTFDFAGNITQPGPDENTRNIITQRLEPAGTVVGGNYADLQRAGAEAAAHGASGGLGDSVVLPPGTDQESVVTAAEAEAARGEFTRETERTGLVEQAVPEPAEEVGGRSFDPTSTSPQRVEPEKASSSRRRSSEKDES